MIVKVLDKNEKSKMEKIFHLQMSAYLIEADILEVQTLPPLQESMEDLISSKEEILIYMLDNSPKGAIFLDKERDSITINKLVVDPNQFRKGIGKALVKHSIDLYPGLRFKVSTGKKNAPAINLYCLLGFNIVKEQVVEDGLVLVELQRIS